MDRLVAGIQMPHEPWPPAFSMNLEDSETSSKDIPRASWNIPNTPLSNRGFARNNATIAAGGITYSSACPDLRVDTEEPGSLKKGHLNTAGPRGDDTPANVVLRCNLFGLCSA